VTKVQRRCRVCPKRFTTIINKKLCCSHRCAKRYWLLKQKRKYGVYPTTIARRMASRHKPKSYVVECVWCGQITMTTPNNKNRKLYCSTDCKVEARWDREKQTRSQS